MKIWYDKIAKIYDNYTLYFYKKKRMKLIEHLEIKKGDRILVIACGTGQSFELLENKIGKSGEIIAFDYSEGMLKQAKNKIIKNNWTNINLIKLDAREFNKEFFEEQKIKTNFDIVLGELAFSVIPNWKKVMNISVSLLNKNGKIGLLDWYRKNNDILIRIIDFLAEAETTRNTIDYANKIMKIYKIEHFFFKSVYVAIGMRK